MYTTGALFAPSYDLQSVTADGIEVDSLITVTTGAVVSTTFTVLVAVPVLPAVSVAVTVVACCSVVSSPYHRLKAPEFASMSTAGGMLE